MKNFEEDLKMFSLEEDNISINSLEFDYWNTVFS